MPSMGIYCYELFKFYDVDNIIRIGSCGAYTPCLNLFDIVLSTTVYTEGNYALTINNDDCHFVQSSVNLNDIILNKSKELDIELYMTDVNEFLKRIPEGFNPLTAEMESFSLLYTAKMFNKNASCIMTVVDSSYIDDEATVEERQTGLDTMIKLSLESALET